MFPSQARDDVMSARFACLLSPAEEEEEVKGSGKTWQQGPEILEQKETAEIEQFKFCVLDLQ